MKFSRILFSAVAANAIAFSRATNAVTFSPAVQFSEAQTARDIKTMLPTSLTSAELEGIDAEILERAMFSARVTDAEYLQEIDDLATKYLNGEIDLASARVQLKNKLDALKYEPAPGDTSGLKDLSSDARINLQLRMNASMAAGYGNWMQGQAAPILDQWPAQELYRAYARKVPRNWLARWSDAGGSVTDGRLIALKNAPIWIAISRFGTPYPPFDFNSGMSVRDVDRATAMKAGLIDRDTIIAPQTREFNEDLKMSAAVRSEALRSALEENGYTFEGDVLSL
jgi:hypothetical protein